MTLTATASSCDRHGVGANMAPAALIRHEHEPHFSTPLHGCRIMRGYHFTVEGCCFNAYTMMMLALRPYHLGLVTKLDNADWHTAIQWSWESIRDRNTGRRYVTRRITVNGRRRLIVLARFLLGAGPSEEVDHINGDTLDNQRRNLRRATRCQNRGNLTTPSKSESGLYGVHKEQSSGKWLARIGHNRHIIRIGYFNTSTEAALAYDRKAIELRGPITHLNYPNGT